MYLDNAYFSKLSSTKKCISALKQKQFSWDSSVKEVPYMMQIIFGILTNNKYIRISEIKIGFLWRAILGVLHANKFLGTCTVNLTFLLLKVWGLPCSTLAYSFLSEANSKTASTGSRNLPCH